MELRHVTYDFMLRVVLEVGSLGVGVYFIIIDWCMLVSLSCEHTCTTTENYKAFQCFIITTMKTHGNTVDLILSSSLLLC